MKTVLMLVASNVFMTTAWYWHLKSKALPLAAIIAISWLIALPEYCLAIPANRIGHVNFGGGFTAPQLKVLQEGLALLMFIPFTLLVLKEVPRWTDAAGMLLILAGLAIALSGRPS
ncbi:MAG: DMT family protein [Planctomycetes bacterium]|nr:DMT family protein [Planctomycetota bacterium]